MDTREWYMVLAGKNLSKLGRLKKDVEITSTSILESYLMRREIDGTG
jgi:hypothetical protein